MAAPQSGQCQRLELSEGIWHLPVSAGVEELEASSCRHSTRLEALALHAVAGSDFNHSGRQSLPCGKGSCNKRRLTMERYRWCSRLVNPRSLWRAKAERWIFSDLLCRK